MMNGLNCKSQHWTVKAPIASAIFFLLTSTPALAHHAMQGRTPTTLFEGFLSGLAHPIIGLDHFAFVIAVGLLSAGKRWGIAIPIAFLITALSGTGLHLMSVNFPGVEIFVAGSILLFGLLLALNNTLNLSIVLGLAAIAGLAHGYAYGEAIVGAAISPLIAYLLGFTAIQLAISLIAFGVGKVLLKRSVVQNNMPFRPAGWVICGIGLTFFVSHLMTAFFPA